MAIATVVQPNLFDLEGGRTKITYSASSLNGQPQLTYDTGKQSRTFSGDQLTISDTPLGTVVSALVEFLADVKITRLGLFVPIVNLAEDETEHQVETIAVLESTGTPLGGPRLFRGQAQTYKVLNLKGTARLVDF